MEEVFISYASEDRDRATQVANAFRAEGIAAYMDKQIEPGRAYCLEINEKLAKAKCIMPLWSPHSAESEWVIGEAERGRELGKLTPAIVTTCLIPVPFNYQSR